MAERKEKCYWCGSRGKCDGVLPVTVPVDPATTKNTSKNVWVTYTCPACNGTKRLPKGTGLAKAKAEEEREEEREEAAAWEAIADGD